MDHDQQEATRVLIRLWSLLSARNLIANTAVEFAHQHGEEGSFDDGIRYGVDIAVATVERLLGDSYGDGGVHELLRQLDE